MITPERNTIELTKSLTSWLRNQSELFRYYINLFTFWPYKYKPENCRQCWIHTPETFHAVLQSPPVLLRFLRQGPRLATAKIHRVPADGSRSRCRPEATVHQMMHRCHGFGEFLTIWMWTHLLCGENIFKFYLPSIPVAMWLQVIYASSVCKWDNGITCKLYPLWKWDAHPSIVTKTMGGWYFFGWTPRLEINVASEIRLWHSARSSQELRLESSKK